MARLVIVGAGDIARLADFYFRTDSPHEVVAFAVDRPYLTGDTFLGRPLVALDELPRRFAPASHRAFVAMSYAKMNRVRAEKYAAVKALGYELASYVSSRCSYLSETPPGDNCFILEDNTVQPFVAIGNDVTLWSGNHVGHDSTIGDHVFVSSHVVISGHCAIAPFCFLGVNATLHNSVALAEGTLVGAGAVISKDTEPRGVYLPPRGERFKKTSDEIDL
jgi:sugar O-acyltransferase (sialic acid O-acetyltransferase NeuD family)